MFDETENLPALLPQLPDIVAEYDRKSEAVADEVAAFETAHTTLKTASTMGGTYTGQAFRDGHASVREIKASLLCSAWRHVYRLLQLEQIAPASDRKRFDLALKDPAPFTVENVIATFGKYANTREHILRGLAECFCKLDPAFKSHDRMHVGVKGLPKRIILTSVTDYGHYGTEQLKDTINALRVFNGQPHIEWASKHDEDKNLIERGLNDILSAAKSGPTDFDGMTLKRFKNGNAHLHFSPKLLKDINKALAEFYGDVLADCPEHTPEKRTGTAVSKDLAFYRTPKEAVDRLLSKAEPRDGYKVLEPSCGDGAILEGLREWAQSHNISLRATGVEVDKARALEAEAKGFAVVNCNFLQTQPDPVFDLVVMNPPFVGTHYQKHVEHARKFLKPDGVLYAILPVTALTDHGFIEQKRYMYDTWTDLPVGSFSESGTNINTGIARFFAPRA